MATFAARGTFTALVTPFTRDGSAVDWSAFEQHVEEQIAGGVSGVVPCGTTGETATLEAREQQELVQRAVAVARGRVSVLAGVGSNNTRRSVESACAALEGGADALMVVMPYYNKPSQEGLRLHVEQVARAARAPVVLYNIPGRTGVELEVETLCRILDACDNVVAIKDATGGVQYCQSLMARGARIEVLCGDDALTVPMMSVGAVGVVSVTSNLYPAEVSAVVADMLAGSWEGARRKHLRLLPVHGAMFMEPNPVPIKAALAARGRMQPAVRPPLVEANEAARATFLSAVEAYEAP